MQIYSVLDMIDKYYRVIPFGSDQWSSTYPSDFLDILTRESLYKLWNKTVL